MRRFAKERLTKGKGTRRKVSISQQCLKNVSDFDLRFFERLLLVSDCFILDGLYTYMRKAGDAGDIVPANFLDFPPNLEIYRPF